MRLVASGRNITYKRSPSKNYRDGNRTLLTARGVGIDVGGRQCELYIKNAVTGWKEKTTL